MSDLDLDAIRRDLYAAMAQIETPDGNVAFAALQALDRAHKLLVEVEQLKAERDEAHRTIRSLNDNRELDLAAGGE